MERYPVICSILALSILLALLGGLPSDAATVNSCSAWMRCSTVPDNTYGLIGNTTCGIYRNPCLLALENCDRKANNQTLITPTTKAKCQPLCPSFCPLYIQSFCAEYLNKKMTFNNECEMNRYNCKNDKTYRLYSQGACKCSSGN